MKSLSLIFLTLIFSVAAYAQDEVSLSMSLNKDTISIDEYAYLTISVSGPRQNLPSPELPNLTMFNVYSQGTSTNISIVNGKMQASYSYQYLLQPKKQGTYPIKPAFLVIDRKRYESNELTLTVLSGGEGTSKSVQKEAITQTGENREVFLAAEVNKKSAFVSEQMILTVKFFHAVQILSQPEYTAPQTTDFWTDILEGQRSYYEIVNGQRYKVVEISSALFPTRSGDLTIGPAMVTVNVPSRRAPRRNDPFSLFDDFLVQGEQRTVRSRPITVNIKPLPAEGKPESFSGTVGNFSIDAVPDKTIVDANQPVTVKYKITGTGNIKTVAEPVIEELKDFRVYRASTDEKISKVGGVVGGTKIFDEVYIPRRAGKLTIPQVFLSFFDPATRKYKVISTKPIDLEVRPAAEVADYGELPLRPVAGRVIDPKAKDILYIKTDSNLRRPEPLVLFTPLYLFVNGVSAMALLAVWVTQRRRQKLANDVGYARSRMAKRLARKHLSKASRLSQTGQIPQFYAEIRRALITYLADKMNLSPHGLTSDMILEILKKHNLPEDITLKFQEIMKQADFAQYASSAVSPALVPVALKEAEELLVKLEAAKIGA